MAEGQIIISVLLAAIISNKSIAVNESVIEMGGREKLFTKKDNQFTF